MRAGKDVMVDKPGVTDFEQLAAIEKTVAETGRIFSICFSERFVVPATIIAGKLIADGAIGRVIQDGGPGPASLQPRDPPRLVLRQALLRRRPDRHRLAPDRPVPAFHRLERSAEIVASGVGHFGDPDFPDFEDFGEILLRSDRAGGYIRVDWFTADGLPTWGDGRLTILGTEGTIELRKYVDVTGRPGTDHVFLVDKARNPPYRRLARAADLFPQSRRRYRRAQRNRDEPDPRLHRLLPRAGSAGQGGLAAGETRPLRNPTP